MGVSESVALAAPVAAGDCEALSEALRLAQALGVSEATEGEGVRVAPLDEGRGEALGESVSVSVSVRVGVLRGEAEGEGEEVEEGESRMVTVGCSGY